MSDRAHLLMGRPDVDDYGHQQQMLRENFGLPSSSSCPATMASYSTPAATDSRATSISHSTPPMSPSQRLDVLRFPMSDCLVNCFAAAASASASSSSSSFFHRAGPIGDWSLPVSTCENSYSSNLRLGHYSAGLNSLSTTTSLDAMAFSTSFALSSSIPRTSASLDFNFGQHQASLPLEGNIGSDGCQFFETEDTESWTSDHLDLGRSQSAMELSSQQRHGAIQSTRLSPSNDTQDSFSPSAEASFSEPPSNSSY